ncbi:unnamed protein product [Calypogeia fissa]
MEIHQHKAAKCWEVEAEESERKAHVHDKQRNQEFQHQKAKYWQQLRTEDDEHKATVHKRKDRNQGFQQRKTAKYWQQLQKQEGGQTKAKGQQKDRNRAFQKHKAAKYWQQRLPQEDDHDSNVQQQETNQEIQQHKAKYWKLHSEEMSAKRDRLLHPLQSFLSIPGSDDAFPGSFGRDRFSVAKRKEYEGRSPAATREKTPRSQSSPRQHYLEKPAS